MCYRWERNQLFYEIITPCTQFCNNLHKHEKFGFLGYGAKEFLINYNGGPPSMRPKYRNAVEIVEKYGLQE